MSQNDKESLAELEAELERSLMEPTTPRSPALDDTEAQMRRALGLDGSARSRPEPERSEPNGTMRLGDRFGGMHKRRFMQDGEVKVSYVRRETAPDVAQRAAAQASPLTARLHQLESAMTAETNARHNAERQLTEAQANIRDLRTKLGHADLARTDAENTLRRERENHLAQRATEQAQPRPRMESDEKINTIRQELRDARSETSDAKAQIRSLEKALRRAEQAREALEQKLRDVTKRMQPTKAAPAVVVVDDDDDDTADGPAPVKWWLAEVPAKRR